MARVRARDTQPEMIVRRLVHGMGHRYRLHVSELPGKPDLVFRSRLKVIFVHGCFWHGHEGCERARRPQSNTEFWNKKLQRNIERDAAQLQGLREAGWRPLVIWQCETKDEAALTRKLQEFLGLGHQLDC